MATTIHTSKSVLILSFFFIVSLIPTISSDDNVVSNNSIEWWCSTTPHPDPCNYFMGRDSVRFSPKTREDFRTMTIVAALERAADAQARASKVGECKSKRKTIIRRDCNSLIDNTILQLNTTLESIQTNASFTDFDAQTWLSTALTNIEICRRSSNDLNVTKFSSPILTGNVSEMISNSLATNGALLDNSSTAGNFSTNSGGFPGWVSGRDRKLLQDLQLATKANVIVALDGSGQFKSVQAAINYATSKRVGNGRVVVYVKKGVYRENIMITRTMNKVMLVGAGLRYTIITGSRSVSAGFTTYSSATVGKSSSPFSFYSPANYNIHEI